MGTLAKQVDFLLTGYRHPTTDLPLSGGKVHTYLNGTSTQSSLWTGRDKAATTTNPIILDSAGRAEVYGDDIYKFVITDADDAAIETINDLDITALAGSTGVVFSSDTDASGFSFVLDEDDLVSDDDEKLPTQQSVKAYIDDEIATLEGQIGSAATRGRVIIWTTGTPPSGFLECDGSAISRTTYSDLFGVISDDYGAGDGSTTFNIPDYRGCFLRGFDNTAGNDPGAATVVLGDTHSNTTIDSIASTADLEAGMVITGSGIPSATTISSITSATAIVISQAATATASGVSLTNTNRTDRGDGTTGDANGTKQASGSKRHSHGGATASGGGAFTTYTGPGGGGATTITTLSTSYATSAALTSGLYAPAHTHVISSEGEGESRPLNVNTMFCIKY